MYIPIHLDHFFLMILPPFLGDEQTSGNNITVMLTTVNLTILTTLVRVVLIRDKS